MPSAPVFCRIAAGMRPGMGALRAEGVTMIASPAAEPEQAIGHYLAGHGYDRLDRSTS